jgi:hypothetical protein
VTNPPGSLAFECALIATISQHHAGLVPNIDKDKFKTGMFIPHMYGRTEELKALFPGVIISLDTPPQERGVKVLGSSGCEGDGLDLAQLAQGLHQGASGAHAAGGPQHLFVAPASSPQPSRPLPHHAQVVHAKVHAPLPHASAKPHTRIADHLGDTFVLDYCTGGRRTKLPKDPNIVLVEQVHYYRLFLPYKAGVASRTPTCSGIPR